MASGPRMELNRNSPMMPHTRPAIARPLDPLRVAGAFPVTVPDIRSSARRMLNERRYAHPFSGHATITNFLLLNTHPGVAGPAGGQNQGVPSATCDESPIAQAASKWSTGKG